MGIRSIRHHGATYSLRFDRQGARWHVEFVRMERSTQVVFVSRDRKRRAIVRAVHAAIEGTRQNLDRRG